jgi:mRNA interferase RelE/StbE
VSAAYRIDLTPTAIRDLRRLPVTSQRRIGRKLQWFVEQADPLAFARPVVGTTAAGQYRFRIGEYRVVFDRKGRLLTILSIEHRRDVYRRR